jgi:hypothetical protein
MFAAGFSLALFFYPEDGGEMFLRNVRWLSTDYMALYPRRYHSSLFNYAHTDINLYATEISFFVSKS